MPRIRVCDDKVQSPKCPNSRSGWKPAPHPSYRAEPANSSNDGACQINKPCELLPATNKHVDVRAASVGAVDRDGRIKTQREYFDQADILAQLGLMPHSAIS